MRPISSFFITTLFLLFTSISFAGDAESGLKLFKSNCASCHHMEKTITGPALMGVMDRVPSKEWLYDWIKDNNALRATGDAYANEVFNANGKAAMTGFAWMSDEQLDDIITYISSYAPPSGDSGNGLIDCTEEVVVEEDNSLLWIFGLIMLSLLIISIFTGINRSLKSMKSVKDGGEELENQTFYEAIKEFAVRRKILTGLIVLVIIGGILDASAGWAFTIGVSGGNGYENTENVENYKPTQPIYFKHNIHVKQNKIDCEYCHSGALEGKHALIPSANVCMNCHAAVTEGHCEGSGEEIQKIYEATGWNPSKKQYEHADGKYYDVPRDDKPIKWVKVHNLQDFVYFNHSQHVVVGGIECETCHGDVENMTTAEQHAPLTMGWCIDCHKDTKINEKLSFSGKPSGYYEKMHDEFKEAYKRDKDFEFTVDKIGGLECGKCHY
ncbi:MAG: cytochrome c2 [Saprospiraceae bacterium]|jgi:cytochrome c2